MTQFVYTEDNSIMSNHINSTDTEAFSIVFLKKIKCFFLRVISSGTGLRSSLEFIITFVCPH